jgi:hypothetical protein
MLICLSVYNGVYPVFDIIADMTSAPADHIVSNYVKAVLLNVFSYLLPIILYYFK